MCDTSKYLYVVNWEVLEICAWKHFSQKKIFFLFRIFIFFINSLKNLERSPPVTNFVFRFHAVFRVFRIKCTLKEHQKFLSKTEISLISDKSFTMVVYYGDFRFWMMHLHWWLYKSNSCNKNCTLVLWSEWRGHFSRFQFRSRLKMTKTSICSELFWLLPNQYSDNSTLNFFTNFWQVVRNYWLQWALQW